MTNLKNSQKLKTFILHFTAILDASNLHRFSYLQRCLVSLQTLPPGQV